LGPGAIAIRIWFLAVTSLMRFENALDVLIGEDALSSIVLLPLLVEPAGLDTTTRRRSQP
jgi:hypothetical protein